MTDREKAIVMAYTGACMLTGDKFQIFHKYVEDIMGRSVWTHEMALDSIADEIRAKSKDDFIALCVDESSSEIPTSCGDAISRQEAIDAMYELCDTGETLKENPWRDNPHIDAVVEAIEELPSVTPQQRTGRWTKKEHNGIVLFMCSNCRKEHLLLYDYCPTCGAKMEVKDAD